MQFPKITAGVTIKLRIIYVFFCNSQDFQIIIINRVKLI